MRTLAFLAGFVACLVAIAAVGLMAKVRAEPGDVWISMQAISLHEHEPKRGRYNNANWSLGLQYEYSRDVRISGAYFKDSYYKDNFAFGGAWLPLHGQLGDVKLHFGVSAGAALYYKSTPIPFGGFTAAIERGRWGIDVQHIPTKVTIIYLKSLF